jgi:hypothetical protein
LQASQRFLGGLSASQAAWTQHRFFEVIRTGRPGSDDPETVLARVKQNVQARVNDAAAEQLMARLDAFPEEALALALHNIEREKLSPEEKRRRRARQATYYRQLQIRGLGSP